jgi:radical SAM protein with 4Fe4S-binding SPASM domain
VKGNFKKLLQTIEILKKNNQNISSIFTVTKENYNQLLWAWDFAKKNDMNIMFSPEMDYGRLEHETGDRTLTAEEKEEVLRQLKKIYSERKRGFFDRTYLLFFKKFYEKKTISDNCYAGTNSLYIDFTGDIYPCENLVGRIQPFGNIKTGFTMPQNYKDIIKRTRCYEGCYLLCEMVRNMRRHPIKSIREMKNYKTFLNH